MIHLSSSSSVDQTAHSSNVRGPSGILKVSDSQEKIETQNQGVTGADITKCKNQNMLALEKGQQMGCLAWFKRGSKIPIKTDGLCLFRCMLVYKTEDLDYGNVYSSEKIIADFKQHYDAVLTTAFQHALLGTRFNMFEKYYIDKISNELQLDFTVKCADQLLANLSLLWHPPSVFELAKITVKLFETTNTPSDKTQLPRFYCCAREDKRQANLFSNLFFSNLVGAFGSDLLSLKNNHYSLSKEAEIKVLSAITSQNQS